MLNIRAADRHIKCQFIFKSSSYLSNRYFVQKKNVSIKLLTCIITLKSNSSIRLSSLHEQVKTVPVNVHQLLLHPRMLLFRKLVWREIMSEHANKNQLLEKNVQWFQTAKNASKLDFSC